MPTAVFLFTDIEGSTRRWSADAASMGDALEKHDLTLADAVSATGGVVFKHTGDGMLFWFSTAAAALAAAAEAQRRLGEVDWGVAVAPMRVRMAVHAGDATPRDEDWFGPALNRCARLLSVGHGGQVLVSDAARALCVDSLPRGLELVDLGSHQLQDLLEAERVWQLAAVGLPASFPPLRTIHAFPGNLPTLLTDFVGRADEISKLRAAVDSHRLVTVTGPGGIGKTRVAIEVGESLAHAFPGGVWLVELASLERGDGVAHAVIAALGVEGALGLSCGQLVARFLADRRALIILDNCEHVTTAAAEVVEDLLRLAPTLRVLATSRQPLGLLVEHLYVLGALTTADQASLFRQRAEATGQAREADPDLVLAVCRELDGMPLAIELAAARLRSMTLPELAERLPQRFRLLKGGRSGAPHHRSLEALVAWSYDQLTPAERSLFANLSVFYGEFDLSAAHAVAGALDEDDLDTLSNLDALVDKSLVVATERDHRSRYSLLETLRQYGEGQLGDRSLEVRARHADYFMRLIPTLKKTAAGMGARNLTSRIEYEFANIRVAFQFALAHAEEEICLAIVSELAPYAQLRPTLELADWADQALALASDAPSPRVVRAHLAASSIRHYLADWTSAEQHARAALALDAQLDGSMAASALSLLAPPLCYLGRVEEAYAAAQSGVAAAERSGRPVILAAARSVYLFPAIYTGRAPTVEDIEELRVHVEEADSLAERAYALSSYGIAAMLLNRPDAPAVLGRSVTAADAIGGVHMSCLGRSYLALAEAGPEPASALRALRVALVEYAAARIPFGPRQLAAELLHFFADAARWATVAVLDGATPPVSLYPEPARAARLDARRALGDAAYEALASRGRAMLHDEFESFLHAELDELGVAHHQPTLPYSNV